MTKLPLFPTLGKTLKKSFLEYYSNMGFSALMSLIWFLGYLPILFLILSATSIVKLPVSQQFSFFIVTVIGVGIWNGLCVGPLTTGLYVLYQNRKTDYPNIKMFWQGLKKVYLRSAVIHWLFSLVVILLIVNVIIGIREPNLLLLISGILSAYILLLVLLMVFYVHPLIYLENTIKKVIKKSFLLTLDNMGLSLGIGITMGFLLLVSFVLVFPLALFYGSIVIYLTEHGFEPIYQKYD